MSQATATFLAWHIASNDLELVSSKQVSAASQVLVLMQLAAHADDNSTAYPTQVRLAKYCYLSRSTVQYALKALEAAGHIMRLGSKKGRGIVARYLILPDHAEQIKANADDKLAAAKKSKVAGQDAGQVAGQDAGQVAGQALYKEKEKEKEKDPLVKTATKSQGGGILEKEQKEQPALGAKCIDMDFRQYPPQYPPGKALIQKMSAEYQVILSTLPDHLTDSQKVTTAVAQRHKEPANIILLTPPAPPSDDDVERTPEQNANIKKIQAGIKALATGYAKRV